MTDEELTAAIREVQARARARSPQGSLGLDGVEAADLMPLVHARDAAQAKVAAIGTVNPRKPGLLNSAVQTAKRGVARALDWHIREQIEFNRAAMECVEASLSALNGTGRSVAALSAHVAADRSAQASSQASLQASLEDALRKCSDDLQALVARHMAAQTAALEGLRSQQSELEDALRSEHAAQLEDLRQASNNRYEALRQEVAAQRAADEAKRVTREKRITDLLETRVSALLETRISALSEQFRDLALRQHRDFNQALERNTVDVQQRLWNDLSKVREEFEGLIHRELRQLRQRESLPASMPTAMSVPSAPMAIDWLAFAERFRGSEQDIRAQQRRYVETFTGTAGVILDIGCGRGEFLDALREDGLSGLGIDANAECVALCREKGLRTECADLFAYIESQPDASLAGVHCAQVIEHLAPASVAHLARLLGAKMKAGAWLAVETPNPECLAIFATYFYADPTHTRPVPAPLMRFYLEEAGFGSITVERLNPAARVLPAIADLPEPFREAFFGGMDYAIFARKL